VLHAGSTISVLGDLNELVLLPLGIMAGRALIPDDSRRGPGGVPRTGSPLHGRAAQLNRGRHPCGDRAGRDLLKRLPKATDAGFDHPVSSLLRAGRREARGEIGLNRLDAGRWEATRGRRARRASARSAA
jgi:hypothetical protein